MDEIKVTKKGFNQGYLLQHLNPELAATIRKGFVDDKTPYSHAFIKGIEEKLSEKTISKHKNFDIQRFSPTKSTKTKDMDKDKG